MDYLQSLFKTHLFNVIRFQMAEFLQWKWKLSFITKSTENTTHLKKKERPTLILWIFIILLSNYLTDDEAMLAEVMGDQS